jgi:beta-lactamase class A
MRHFAGLLFALAFVAQPAAAASSPSLNTLEQQLQSMVSAKSADVGIAALDLSNGTGVSIHGDQSFPMASTVKVAVAALYLSQVDHGQKTLDDTINGQPVRSLMARMLIHSDNHATDIILADIGGPHALHQWLQQNDVTGLRVDRTIAQLLHDPRDLWDRRDSSTPQGMVDFLKRIYSAELIKPESRNYLLSLMSRCETGKNRIKALLPGVPIEHKTGTLNGLADDVGFITLPDGRTIAVAIFTRGGSDRPRTIAQAARAVYDGFKTAVTWPFGAAALNAH